MKRALIAAIIIPSSLILAACSSEPEVIAPAPLSSSASSSPLLIPAPTTGNDATAAVPSSTGATAVPGALDTSNEMGSPFTEAELAERGIEPVVEEPLPVSDNPAGSSLLEVVTADA